MGERVYTFAALSISYLIVHAWSIIARADSWQCNDIGSHDVVPVVSVPSAESLLPLGP
jgi:hypothetical protein